MLVQTVEEKIARHSESGTVTERCYYLSHLIIFIIILLMTKLVAYYTLYHVLSRKQGDCGAVQC